MTADMQNYFANSYEWFVWVYQQSHSSITGKYLYTMLSLIKNIHCITWEVFSKNHDIFFVANKNERKCVVAI
ncbi:hypothetical protein NIES22_11070 [Calothrix brevissima NIES-22]|nr:hypothetical protein NIES22_11070 [Calothrix brevissima NIES-22]